MSLPSDILKKNGTWMRREDFLKDVTSKFGISERQAQRKINRDKEIQKVKRGIHTYYGLKSWPPPLLYGESNRTVTISKEFYNRVFHGLGNIADENIEGNSLKAFIAVKHQVAMLPKPLQERLKPEIDAAEALLLKTKGVDYYTTLVRRRRVARVLVRQLIGKISSTLHETITI